MYIRVYMIIMPCQLSKVCRHGVPCPVHDWFGRPGGVHHDQRRPAPDQAPPRPRVVDSHIRGFKGNVCRMFFKCKPDQPKINMNPGLGNIPQRRTQGLCQAKLYWIWIYN